MVDCDWVLIEQVISNLARNGIEAMIDTPIERRQLTLSTHLTAAGSVNVSIEDRGHGLPRANPDRLFDAFFTTKKEGPGSDCPCAARSSIPTEATCGPPTAPAAAQNSTSACH
jgi:C4-dicarboxylate-specific signal transduction histidine kinase